MAAAGAMAGPAGVVDADLVDLPFVLALQAVRLLFVIALAPMITRLVVRHSPHLRRSS